MKRKLTFTFLSHGYYYYLKMKELRVGQEGSGLMVGYSNPLSPSPNNAAAVAQNPANMLAAQQQQQQAYSHQVINIRV